MAKKYVNGSSNIGHNSGSLWLRRSYNFITKDPECDKFRTLFQKEHIKEDDLAAIAGLATTTVKNLFGGKTQAPRHATFAKIASAMGYTYELSRELKPNYEKEIPKAKEQRSEYRAQLAEQRAREERKIVRTKKRASENQRRA